MCLNIIENGKYEIEGKYYSLSELAQSKWNTKDLIQVNIKDTQCGFKLYKNKTAKLLFKKVKDNGYVHDVEVVLLSKKYNFPIKELPVAWTHRDDSKLNLLTDTFKMFYNLIKIRKNFI